MKRGGSAGADVRDRTVLLTPWRGAPTFLHAAAFVQELEKRYGKVQWAGVSKEDANPYEYRPTILVIFEDAASLQRIPGFTTNLGVQSSNGLSTNDPSSSSTGFDLGPTTRYDPTWNEASQDMLRQIDQEKGGSKGKNVSPLFMPWSDKLNELAYRKGGSSLEDLLPFFSSLDIREEGIFKNSSSTPALGKADGKVLVQSKSSNAEGPLPMSHKATWEEFDEPVSIDAVIRQWDMNKVFLPAPPLSDTTMGQQYIRPKTRMNIARAFLDFGGFAEKPVPAMESVMKQWKEEVDAATGSRWIPWDPNKEEEIAEVPRTSESTDTEATQTFPNEDLDLSWEDVSPSVWSSEPQEVGEDETDVVPKERSYQRIAAEDDEHGEEEWEGLGAHPLQYPNRTASTDSPSSKPETPKDSEFSVTFSKADGGGPVPATELEVSLSAKREGAPIDGSRDSWDTWRTEPRPFRSGLGGDEPQKFIEWSKPGSLPKNEQQRAAMLNGSHSPKSRAWDLDKRGRKMKSREVIQELGRMKPQQSNGVDKQRGPAEGEEQDSIERASKRAENEKLLKERRDLKERLRAILDGTTID
ncbi:hypothetical protein CPB86DRAFT_798781 [Serendipita vermifera]|nr:hypothetical protein CPB86DRAFT_798781 [Serendipita vermifera]